MASLVRRTFVSVILVALALLIIYARPLWVFSLATAVFVAFAQFEFFRMAEQRGVFVYKYFGTVVGALVPIVIYMGHDFPELSNLESLLIVVACLFAFTLQFIRKENSRDHLISVSVTLFSLFYISWFFSFLAKIRFLDNGANLVAFLILVTKGTDIGAYVIGTYFGKSELVPKISPKKTKEGTLGGILVSAALAAAAGTFLTHFSVWYSILMGIILAVIGQVGDLAESLIKRDCGVKDSGAYLFDIGGVFDLIDSLLFTAPVFYFFIKTF